MSTTTGRVFAGLTRTSFSQRICLFHNSAVSRLNSVRSLALSSQRPAKRHTDVKEVNNEPIKFTTSKASHRTWKVDRSMGAQFRRPYSKVLPISLLCTIFVLWCALRDESNLDTQLKKPLHEHLPGLLPDEEEDEDEEQEQNKSS